MAGGPDPEWVDDYAPGEEDHLTGEAVSLDLYPVGFVLRAVGSLLDAVVYVSLFVFLTIGTTFGLAAAGVEGAVMSAVSIGILVLCAVILPATVEVVTRGRSLGKIAIGGRIVRRDGGAIGLRHAAVRSLVGVVEITFTLGGGAAITGLLTPRTERLGDLVAGTYCRSERVSGRVLPVFGVPAPLAEWARVADVARMPASLARRISQFILQAPEYDRERRARLAAELAAEAEPFVAPVPDVDPELLLAGITVLRREREAAALRAERERLERLAPVLRAP